MFLEYVVSLQMIVLKVLFLQPKKVLGQNAQLKNVSLQKSDERNMVWLKNGILYGI